MMKEKVAIYDPSYFSGDEQAQDYWATLIDGRSCDTVAAEYSLRGVMKSIKLMTVNPDRVPKTVFVAEKFDDDLTYIKAPEEYGRDVVLHSPRRQLLGMQIGRQAVNQNERKIWLPGTPIRHPRKEDVELPTLRERHRGYDLGRIQDNYRNALYAANAQNTPAIFIVSHIIHSLFPDENMRVIGVSNQSISDEMYVSARISRTIPEAGRMRRMMAQKSAS